MFRGDTFGGADSIGAEGSSSTLEVGATGLQRHVTALERITSHARRTRTERLVVLSDADGINSTLGNGARINTLVLVARLGQGTISIGSASWNTLDTLANFIATAVIVTLANLLANVVNT